MSKNTATTVKLNTPIKIGDKSISEITLRKPMAGELRGIKMAEISLFDVDAFFKLLPRITDPALTDGQCASMDCADMFKMMTTVGGFLLPDDIPTA